MSFPVSSESNETTSVIGYIHDTELSNVYCLARDWLVEGLRTMEQALIAAKFLPQHASGFGPEPLGDRPFTVALNDFIFSTAIGCRRGSPSEESVMGLMALWWPVALARAVAKCPNLRRAPRSTLCWPSSAEFED